jgi:hypothetical protein
LNYYLIKMKYTGCQESRANWSKFGDGNSSFFHNLALAERRRICLKP